MVQRAQAKLREALIEDGGRVVANVDLECNKSQNALRNHYRVVEVVPFLSGYKLTVREVVVTRCTHESESGAQEHGGSPDNALEDIGHHDF